MAKFQLNSGLLPEVASRQPQRVRIGAISVLTLMVVICLAVLAVLSLTTANASLIMTQRQADAMSELYLDERAAQEFVAGVDAILTESSGTSPLAEEARVSNLEDANAVDAQDESGIQQAKPAAKAAFQPYLQPVQSALDELCADASAAAGGMVEVTASVRNDRVKAEFDCGNGRLLTVVMTVDASGAYRIDKWKMIAVQNEEPAPGQLMIVD